MMHRTQSAEPNRRPKLVFIDASDLDNVVLDEDERTNDASTLMELLEPPIADPVLCALREAFTKSYFSADRREAEAVLVDIRHTAIRVLGELGPMLDLLRLPRVDGDKSFERDESAKLFKYMIVPAKELKRRVDVEGERKRHSLADLFQTFPADPAIQALRQVLSMTFSEATTRHQHERILEDIRFLAAEVLVPCNQILEEIEREPVAMPTRRRFVDGVDTLSGEGEGDGIEGGAAGAVSLERGGEVKPKNLTR